MSQFDSLTNLLKKEVLCRVGSISDVDVEIATLPKIILRSKLRFCIPQLSMFSSI